MRFVPRRTADIRGILARPKSFLQRSLQAMSMTLACLAATAAANDVLYTGGATLNGTGDFSPANIFSAPGLNEFVTVNVNTIDLVGPAVDTVRVVGFQGNINFNLSAGRSISGAGVNGAYLTTTTGNITSVVDGNLPGLTNGIVMDARFAPLGGNVDLSGTGDINGVGGWGVWLLSDTGSVTMNGINSITAAAGHGIYVDSTGTVNLGTTTPLGTINAGLSGIEVIQVFDPVNNGPISVHTGDITAGGFGVHTLGWEQNTWVRMPGTLTSTGTTGIYSTSTLGNIIVDGLGTGVVIGADEGITLGSTAGNQTVQNFASVTGADTALWMLSGTGNQLVSNNGTLTGTLGDGILAGTLGGNISIQGSGTVGGINGGGRDGINANAFGGNLNIGDVAANGPITGADDGIEAYTFGAGNMTVVTTQNITGNGAGQYGIFLRNTGGGAGAIDIDINGGTTEGNGFGIDAATAGTGNIDIDVASGATVQGQLYGLATGTTTGLATITNDGLVRDTTDTGAASDAGGDAIWSYAGNTVVNNTGDIVGRVHSNFSTTFTMNNQAGGVWTPGIGLNGFGAPNDVVNNAGLINVRTGSTTFSFLDQLNNQSGGLIDLSYGPNATDDLIVLGFSPMAGSAATFNFNSTGANLSGLGFDNSTNGLGTADTIVVVGTSTPSAFSTVNLVNSGGTPTALAGSVALVYTGTNLVAPNPGAIIADSSFYAFGTGDPTTGAVRFYLVDDGSGGVYLQWAPNLTPASLGGFAGGDLSTGSGSTSGALLTIGQLGSAVGGVGPTGGPSGGGVAGMVADSASRDTQMCDCIFCEDACGCPVWRTWVQSGASASQFSPTGGGTAYGLAAGAEADLETPFDGVRSSVGLFGFGGQSRTKWLTGQGVSDNYGGGAYIRSSHDNGLYSSFVGSVSNANTSLVNNIFNSTGSQNSVGYSLIGSVGLLTPISDTTSVDLRQFVSYGNVFGYAFADSNGLVVNRSESNILTFGSMVGLNHAISDRGTAYVRGGVKWYDIDRSQTVGATTLKGSGNGWVPSTAVGLRQQLTDRTSVDLMGYGDFGPSLQNGGGNATWVFQF